MNTCKTCEAEYRQGGSDPTLLIDECWRCELERLRSPAVYVLTYTEGGATDVLGAYSDRSLAMRMALALYETPLDSWSPCSPTSWVAEAQMEISLCELDKGEGPMTSKNFRLRYMTEPTIANITNMLVRSLVNGDITPRDLDRCVSLAAEIGAQTWQARGAGGP